MTTVLKETEIPTFILKEGELFPAEEGVFVAPWYQPVGELRGVAISTRVRVEGKDIQVRFGIKIDKDQLSVTSAESLVFEV